ncbi:MAG: hypothetical protein ACRDHN_19855, partial [Thermomicrobiales bacterium]
PGLSRGAKTEELAVEQLNAYLPRYAPIAKLAGMEAEFDAGSDVEVVERFPGTGSTDFWGISFAFSEIDRQPISSAELERELTLMQACWANFDDVRGRVSEEMRKGPRGGGRDRDTIIRHTLGTEQGWTKQFGSLYEQTTVLTDEGLRKHREQYVAAIRTLYSEGETERIKRLRHLIRHTSFHTLDHAWEMEDKDLSADDSPE